MAGRTSHPRIFLLLICLLVTLCLPLWGCSLLDEGTPSAPPATGEVRVTVLDVGQGDAICIQAGDGSTMLIDTGDTATKAQLVTDLKALGVTQLDYLVLTHAHADHIGGAQAVIEAFPIKKVLISPQAATSKVYTNTLKALQAKNIPTKRPAVGEAFTLGDAQFTSLGPAQDQYSDINNSSIVLRMTHGDKAFLFTGDMEALEEREILATGTDLSCDVLKAAHHGSDTSTTDPWLAACGPNLDTILISVGADNDYGLPGKRMLARGETYRLYRTDLQGAVTVVSDGQTISITSEH
ncbi:ComEC/Rec2 family competence protein [Eubacterium sp.]|uniref:ComEC/Rec2 family competence protein n=1 Tax=Eubacterium sp. TaxID=142586 RepID=UPI002FC80A47